MNRFQSIDCGCRHQRGLSLVELMIAMAIGLIILAAATAAFIGATQTRTELDKSSRQYENGRYALQLLVEDLRLAGFWGDFYGSGFTVTEPANLCAIATPAEMGWDIAGLKYPPHIRGWESGSPACSGIAIQADTDVVLVRRASTDAIPIGSVGSYPNSVLMQMSRCSADNATLPIVALGSAGAATFTYKKKNTGDGLGVCSGSADLRRMQTSIYYVGTDLILHRREVGTNNTWSDVSLVDGIEELQIEYDVDTNSDGIPDALGQLASGIANWDNVVAATIYVLARNTETTAGYEDKKTYALGQRTVAPKGDGYKRHVYSQKVFFANPAGRRAP